MIDESAEHRSIPLVEESVTVTTHDVVVGKLRVRSETEIVDTLAHADLAGEEIEITRVPVGRPVDAVPEIRTEGNVTIFPVVEEVLVVEKRLVLREEVHLTRKPTSERIEVPVSLRRQRAVVERIDPKTGRVFPRDASDHTED